MFENIPERYELINHVLTMGLDIFWRRNVARCAARSGGTKWLDICTGTGETAIYLHRAATKNTSIYAVDFTESMVREFKRKRDANCIRILVGEAALLPFPDHYFNMIIISFASRNLNITQDHFLQCLREFYRVLKPGGRFINLETSRTNNHLIRRLYHLYIHLVVAPVGRLISSEPTSYQYLSQSMRRFYDADTLEQLIRKAGFDHVTYRQMMFGATAVHKAIKTS